MAYFNDIPILLAENSEISVKKPYFCKPKINKKRIIPYYEYYKKRNR